MSSVAGPSHLHGPASVAGAGDMLEDGDYCRICRLEGSPEEPLFYPCKCSGSIKYVHQECLMQWLAHSQKKYCELCKTPFRFTKLYDPRMPSNIPLPLFLQRAGRHVANYVWTICRGLLAGTVWLVILPVCMRFVWHGLFYFADLCWIQDQNKAPGHVLVSVSDADRAGPANASTGEAQWWADVKRYADFLPSFFGLSPATEANTNTSITTSAPNTIRPSLLSNVRFFHWFASDVANRYVLDVFEGIIITLGVVFAFILIFLIREWVVQQQPVINFAAHDENELRARVPDPADAEHVEEHADDVGEEEEIVEDHVDNVDDHGEPDGDEHTDAESAAIPPAATPSAQPGQGTHQETEDDQVPDNWDDDDISGGDEEITSQLPETSEAGSSGSWQRISQNEGQESASAPDSRPSDATSSSVGTEATPETDGQGEVAQLDAEAERHQEPAAPAQVPPPPRPYMDTFLDWIYGDIAPAVQAVDDGANDEHVVEDLAAEAPFVPFAGNEPREQDPGVAAAAAQAGINVNDQDAIDDAEDLEGLMEMIGMQGPLIGLVQNVLLGALLVSIALLCAVGIPYIGGKLVLVVLGSPTTFCIHLPLKIIATLMDLFYDIAVLSFCGLVSLVAPCIYIVVTIISLGTLSGHASSLSSWSAKQAATVMRGSAERQVALFAPLFNPETYRFSIDSLTALRSIQKSTSSALTLTSNAVLSFLESTSAESSGTAALRLLQQLPSKLQQICTIMVQSTRALLSWLVSSKTYKITFNLDFGHNLNSSQMDAGPWTATDRLITICAGYACFALIGAAYLRYCYPLGSSRQARGIEREVAELLKQAGGVLKVILIISIEMLVFPLYCGLLLDMAMLPLFKDASLYTRWQFASGSPWTSVFIHWFIGTCYMFHFALFVSMCRKTMRKGVLYFIRDPDDPTFHPVRDVLERSVATQLKKIAFSALVYGALVVICLGGVVLGLDRLTTGILPIQWSSQAPSVEFPLNLLVYNFLTPFIIKVYKPSDGLQLLYQWWFKSSARLLRLSNFLFGEKVKDEEGHHVRHTWYSWFVREKGDPERPLMDEKARQAAKESGQPYFVFDGKYVRAPASDQTRIPKGERVFVEVDENNNRKDGKTEGGVHNTDAVTMVYVPPWFRVRITLFVGTIWIFAAATGITFTILPLLFGRYLFSFLLWPTAEKNDIHALTLGLYSLGAIGYGTYRLYTVAATLNGPVPSPLATVIELSVRGFHFGLRVVRVAYVWTTLVFVIPLLMAMLLELYFLVPLHAYIGSNEPHVVPIIQDWTLGFLYARVMAQVVFSGTSRAARAFTAVVANGYLNPNARIATRCFLLPVLIIFGAAVVAPSSLALLLNSTAYRGASDSTKQQVRRFSFPLLGLSVVAGWLIRETGVMFNRWRMVIRDEVFLIGERLHNYGDKKAAPPQQVDAPAAAVGLVA